MTIAEVLPMLKDLNYSDKIRALQFLINEIAEQENINFYKERQSEIVSHTDFELRKSIQKFFDKPENKIFHFNLEEKFESVIKLDSGTTLFGEGLYRRQAGAEQYGHVKLEVSAFNGENDFLLVWQINERIIPSFFRNGLIEGIKSWGESNKIKNLMIAVVGGSHHEIDSREISYLIATKQALDNAFKGFI